MPILRTLLWMVVAAAFVVLLFTTVFPWFDRHFVNDPVLDSRHPAELA